MARRAEYAPSSGKKTGKVAAIYCRISDDKEDRQVGVGRQEEECRETAARLGYEVPEEFVYIDNSKSAWQRNRKRPGWDSMLERLNEGEFDAVIAYHPDRLMRQPRDLEDLLDGALASKKDRRRPVRLVGQANDRDLDNDSDVAMLRIEITMASKSSADTSRRVRSALEDNFKKGIIHGGHRAFGYKPREGERPANMEIEESEAAVIREAAERVLRGDPVRRICLDLNERGILTARGKNWSNATLWALLTGPRIAGLQQRHGEIAGVAPWPAILDIETWNAIRENSDMRASRFWAEGPEHKTRYYLLRGIVHCGACGGQMTGEKNQGKARYRCKKYPNNHNCGQLAIMAESLEAFAVETLLARLEQMDLSVQTKATVDPAEHAQMELDKKQLTELAVMWGNREEFGMTVEEYQAAREPIRARMKARQEGPVAKPRKSLTGLTGAGVRKRWAKLTPERQNAVLRDVFTSITIQRNGRQFDRFVEAGYLDVNRLSIELAF